MLHEHTPDTLIGPAKAGDDGGRTSRGQWRKGRSGNPAGRPRGSRHRVSTAVDELLESRAQELANAAIRTALAGDGATLRALLDRLAPPRRERPITIEMPQLASAADATAAMALIAQRLADGNLVPSEADALSRVVEAWAELYRIRELEERLVAVEAALGRCRDAR